jgi:hypothetical protein
MDRSYNDSMFELALSKARGALAVLASLCIFAVG